MKSRLLLLLLLATILFVLLGQNRQGIRSSLIGFINPIKTGYKNILRNLSDKSHSYLMQKEQIEKLTRENRVLRKYLLDQTHYLRQIASIYNKLPSLQKLPYRNITLVDTVSYVKLNKFDEILLSLPKKTPLEEGKVYGLIQDEVVAGTAQLKKGILYGYLITNPKSRFSVYTGPKRYPGIAMGTGDKLIAVKYIPKWAKIRPGDRVETSGLDGIFFAYVPVGEVVRVAIEGSYKTAYVRPYADTMHPRLFFLITDAKPYLASSYDQNRSFPGQEYPYAHQAPRQADHNISSIPEAVQTKELEINPAEFEIPQEPEPKPVRINKPKKHPKSSTLPKAKTLPTQQQTLPKENMGPLQQQPIPEKKAPRKRHHPSPFDILNETRP
ncbi:rod shape-determining protein MreC [Nitratifractor salsuginis]|uniref:Rod shape-determining protein MreC n=1 Tax=Nitratifractor salsuginis (strain DSM 16511 / JCM 12458 / E9I37-1) TaxID=749222 RepID=E6WYG2_NITSE|nr:rod shape-determining protein MreC [Nitratifractor salsuginis]ADV46474.1 Rod shape-determining protein MreC [Nitratifractor salsuginis DSM 16511]